MSIDPRELFSQRSDRPSEIDNLKDYVVEAPITIENIEGLQAQFEEMNNYSIYSTAFDSMVAEDEETGKSYFSFAGFEKEKPDEKIIRTIEYTGKVSDERYQLGSHLMRIEDTLVKSIKDEKRDRKRQFKHAWIGVGIAVGISLLSIFLNYLSTNKLTTTLTEKYSHYNIELMENFNNRQDEFVKSINNDTNKRLESIERKLYELMIQLTKE